MQTIDQHVTTSDNSDMTNVQIRNKRGLQGCWPVLIQTVETLFA